MTGRENLELVARLFGQDTRTAKANSAPRRKLDGGDHLQLTVAAVARPIRGSVWVPSASLLLSGPDCCSP